MTGQSPRELSDRVAISRYPNMASDPDAVRKHVRLLLDLHHTLSSVCRASDLPYETLWHAMYRNRSITRKTRDAILSVELRPPWETPGLVLDGQDRRPAIGTVRRIRALACMGYPVSQVAKETNGCAVRLRMLAQKPHALVRHQTAEEIAKFYRAALTRIPEGRSVEQTKRWAKRNGWLGPGMWDDIDRDESPVGEGNLAVLVDYVRDNPGLTATALLPASRADLAMPGKMFEELIKEALDSGELVRVRNRRTVRVYAREEAINA